MYALTFILLAQALERVSSQQIYDIWQTSWDQSKLFSGVGTGNPINFTSATAASTTANIIVDDSTVYQTIDGFGGSMTDASALLLSSLKSTNSENYATLMSRMWDPTDGEEGAGLSYIRVPIGANDFSATTYSLDDTVDDTSFADFNISATPSYVFDVMSDILAINSALKIHLLPWSPPRWMKTGDAMNGGSLSTDMVQYYATYLFKAVEAWDAKGFPVYAVSIQNEVLNSNPTYPTALFTPAVEGQVGTMLRTLLNSSSLSAVKIIGYEHNWNDATTYPVELMEAAESAFDGVAFHCYGGTVDEQSDFYALYPSKEIYFTECSGTPGTDWWTDIKYSMNTLWIGGLANWARTGLMWNIAEDEAALPLLPTANDCVDGCRGIVTINTNGTYVLNQEFYGLAQASKAIIPKDVGGPFGQRIENTVEGSADWALIVGSYMTGRVSSTSNRYSLVVLNWDDSSATGTVTPVSVPATIEFRGVRASYTFPVGVTTLTWYAEAEES